MYKLYVCLMCRVNIVHKKCEDTKEKIPKRNFVGHIIK